MLACFLLVQILVIFKIDLKFTRLDNLIISPLPVFLHTYPIEITMNLFFTQHFQIHTSQWKGSRHKKKDILGIVGGLIHHSPSGSCNFIWRPALPLHQVETAELVNRLKLVSLLTAEALYDLWVRPKLQAINGIKKKKYW